MNVARTLCLVALGSGLGLLACSSSNDTGNGGIGTTNGDDSWSETLDGPMTDLALAGGSAWVLMKDGRR